LDYFKISDDEFKIQFSDYDTIGVFPAGVILHISMWNNNFRNFLVDRITYKVNMSERYKLFKRNSSCVCCGVRGIYMVLQKPKNSILNAAHFNLYGIKNGNPILMTKDHIIPKSKGGKDSQYNLRTMCFECNQIRGNEYLSMDRLLEKVERSRFSTYNTLV
jgi:hypothetical protein